MLCGCSPGVGLDMSRSAMGIAERMTPIREGFMTAAEAKEYGIIDNILKEKSEIG